MNLALTDEQTEALIRELSLIIEYDRYRLSPHIRALKEILGQLRPEPARDPLPPTAALRTAEQGPIPAPRLVEPLWIKCPSRTLQ
jgi:hypothetical protein